MSPPAGRPTLAACEWIFGGRPLPETVAALVAAGYDALVVVGEPDRQDLDEVERLLHETGLTVAGSTSETAGNPSRDLAHPDKARRGEAVGYYKGCIDLLERLGAPTLGVVPSAEGRLSAPSYREAWKLAVEATREVALYAGERGVSLAIEPLNRYEALLVNRVEQACRFATEVDVEGVGVIADFFHMNIEEEDLFAAIEHAGDLIFEIHLADSNREGLGTGHLPARELLELVRKQGFQGTFAVECYVRPLEDDDPAQRSAVFLEQCARSVREVFPRQASDLPV